MTNYNKSTLVCFPPKKTDIQHILQLTKKVKYSPYFIC